MGVTIDSNALYSIHRKCCREQGSYRKEKSENVVLAFRDLRSALEIIDDLWQCLTFSQGTTHHVPPLPPPYSPNLNHLHLPRAPSRIRIHTYPLKSTNPASESNKPLPLLHLPYATYRASAYDRIEDIYTFANIRYAAPSNHKNRFAKPQRPLKSRVIQEGRIIHSCYQATPSQFLLARPSLGRITQSEDCLFLDIFVPGNVVRSNNVRGEKLAVVHWIFGGGFGLFPPRGWILMV